MSCRVIEEVKEVQVTGNVDASDFVENWDINYSVDATIKGDEILWTASLSFWDAEKKEWTDEDDSIHWAEVPTNGWSPEQRDDVIRLIFDDFMNQV
jgi:hypothetical protein